MKHLTKLEGRKTKRLLVRHCFRFNAMQKKKGRNIKNSKIKKTKKSLHRRNETGTHGERKKNQNIRKHTSSTSFLPAFLGVGVLAAPFAGRPRFPLGVFTSGSSSCSSSSEVILDSSSDMVVCCCEGKKGAENL